MADLANFMNLVCAVAYKNNFWRAQSEGERYSADAKVGDCERAYLYRGMRTRS